MKFNHKSIQGVAYLGFALSALLLLGGNPVHASHIHNQNQPNTELINQTKKQASINKKITKNNQSNKQGNQFNHVYSVAKSKLGDKYEWGATGPHRFDCSGFTQYVYRHGAHKKLPRTAGAQKQVCKHVANHHEKPGDLAFFGYGHNVEHVGMCIGKGKMIDAQNRGVIIEHIHAPWWHLISYGYPE